MFLFSDLLGLFFVRLRNQQGKLVLIVIVFLGLFGLIENSHAIVPVVVSIEITGPNTITVTYTINVISENANYVDLELFPGGPRNVIGHIGIGTNIITLTFDGAAAAPGTTATLDINGGFPVGVHEAAAPNDPLASLNDQFVANGQQQSTGSGNCKGDCTPPTLGVDPKGYRIVENGFSVNNNPINVGAYYTNYPLISAEVGERIKTVLKIYENSGTDALRHVELVFGLGERNYISDKIASIIWERNHKGEVSVTTYDPENKLGNIQTKYEVVPCKFGGTAECSSITFINSFNEPIHDENFKVGTYVWDSRRNSNTNFFNEGVEIVGETINPLDEYEVWFDRTWHQITAIDYTNKVGIDQNGNIWTNENGWKMEYVPKGKIVDGITKHWIDRNNVLFATYKQGQELLAQHTLKAILDGKLKYYDSLNLNTHPEIFIKSSEDLELQKRIDYEKNRASQWLSIVYPTQLNYWSDK